MAVGDILREFSVPPEASGNARGLAFDGEYLYLTIIDSYNIFKLDLLGNYIATIPTTNIYGGLYYDKNEDVFWAGNYNYDGFSDDGTYEIYKLDTSGNVLFTINYQSIIPGGLLSHALFPSKVMGITIDPYTDTIFFNPTLSRYVYNISKTGEYLGYFDTNAEENVAGLVTDGIDLWLDTPYANPTEIQKYSTSGELLESVVPDPFPIDATSAGIEFDNTTFYPKCVIWMTTATLYSPIIRAIEVDCPIVKRTQAITDIIETVAMEQAALAHILNAEGEKIQKILSLESSPYKLYKVNKSVDDMIKSISKLEIVLQGKLSVFENCLCEYPSCNNSNLNGNTKAGKPTEESNKKTSYYTK